MTNSKNLYADESEIERVVRGFEDCHRSEEHTSELQSHA